MYTCAVQCRHGPESNENKKSSRKFVASNGTLSPSFCLFIFIDYAQCMCVRVYSCFSKNAFRQIARQWICSLSWILSKPIFQFDSFAALIFIGHFQILYLTKYELKIKFLFKLKSNFCIDGGKNETKWWASGTGQKKWIFSCEHHRFNFDFSSIHIKFLTLSSSLYAYTVQFELRLSIEMHVRDVGDVGKMYLLHCERFAMAIMCVQCAHCTS